MTKMKAFGIVRLEPSAHRCTIQGGGTRSFFAPWIGREFVSKLAVSLHEGIRSKMRGHQFILGKAFSIANLSLVILSAPLI